MALREATDPTNGDVLHGIDLLKGRQPYLALLLIDGDAFRRRTSLAGRRSVGVLLHVLGLSGM